MRLRPFILCFYRTAFPIQKFGLKSSIFRSKSFPRISSKSYRHNAVSNRFSSQFSTSLTNGPRLLSRVKAGTHLALGERSHTAAHTPKQGPSLPQPQHGLELPAKSLLFRHAFIYIHFPVLCEPQLSAEGEKSGEAAVINFIPKPLFIPLFNFSHKRPTFAFAGESGYTLGFRRKIAHKGTHGETGGISDGGGIAALGAFRTFANFPGPGIRPAYFAAFGSWPGVLPKNAERLRDSDALMRVAVPRRRGPAGLRDLFATW